jgi:hypothetical protein
MLDRIDFETCNLILEHYEDLTQGRHVLNIQTWADDDSIGVAAAPSFLSKIGEGAQAARAKQRAMRATTSRISNPVQSYFHHHPSSQSTKSSNGSIKLSGIPVRKLHSARSM